MAATNPDPQREQQPERIIMDIQKSYDRMIDAPTAVKDSDLATAAAINAINVSATSARLGSSCSAIHTNPRLCKTRTACANYSSSLPLEESSDSAEDVSDGDSEDSRSRALALVLCFFFLCLSYHARRAPSQQLAPRTTMEEHIHLNNVGAHPIYYRKAWGSSAVMCDD
eukprot:351981-Prorocentrum_minimum.AAC.1